MFGICPVHLSTGHDTYSKLVTCQSPLPSKLVTCSKLVTTC